MTDTTPDLHLFLLCECDYVSAVDIDDAWTVYCEETGNKRKDFDDPGKPIPDDKPVTVYCEETGNKITKSAREWAMENGRGVVFSTEY